MTNKILKLFIRELLLLFFFIEKPNNLLESFSSAAAAVARFKFLQVFIFLLASNER